mmetsp:Transcript_17518/g.19703  ORF Transcript_17518/g.19703 Transcript_17518/m.19703 type:complete len:111 (-) Transcript_17518:199-531(-)
MLTPKSTETNYNTMIEDLMATKDDSPALKPALERKRKNPVPDIKGMILKVYRELKKNSNVVIYPRTKGNRGLHNGVSRRRSQYVGVSKNGGHWQALINVGKHKKYIGTFC